MILLQNLLKKYYSLGVNSRYIARRRQSKKLRRHAHFIACSYLRGRERESSLKVVVKWRTHRDVYHNATFRRERNFSIFQDGRFCARTQRERTNFAKLGHRKHFSFERSLPHCKLAFQRVKEKSCERALLIENTCEDSSFPYILISTSGEKADFVFALRMKMWWLHRQLTFLTRERNVAMKKTKLA
jgi:hypothetical protein